MQMMKFHECLFLIRGDLRMFPPKKCGVKYFLSNASFKFTVWFRIGAYLRTKKNIFFKMLYVIVFLIHKHNQYLTGIQLRLETKVGEGLRFLEFNL